MDCTPVRECLRHPLTRTVRQRLEEECGVRPAQWQSSRDDQSGGHVPVVPHRALGGRSRSNRCRRSFPRQPVYRAGDDALRYRRVLSACKGRAGAQARAHLSVAHETCAFVRRRGRIRARCGERPGRPGRLRRPGARKDERASACFMTFASFGICSIAWPADALPAALDLSTKQGLTAIEIAPYSLFGGWEIPDLAIARLKSQLAAHGLTCAALQGILYKARGAALFVSP